MKRRSNLIMLCVTTWVIAGCREEISTEVRVAPGTTILFYENHSDRFYKIVDGLATDIREALKEGKVIDRTDTDAAEPAGFIFVGTDVFEFHGGLLMRIGDKAFQYPDVGGMRGLFYEVWEARKQSRDIAYPGIRALRLD